MAEALRQVEGNGLAHQLPAPLIGALPTPRKGQEDGNLVAGEWLIALVGNAIDRCMSRKEAAILLNLSEPELSKQLAGVDGKSLNVRRLGALGERVNVALADEIRNFYGLNDPAIVTAQATELITRGLAMFVAGAKR